MNSDNQMYRLLDTPRPCANLGGWSAVVGNFTDVVGWTCFGDFFLRNPGDGCYATLRVRRVRVHPLKYNDRHSFETVFLNGEFSLKHLLRPANVPALKKRLGELGPDEIFGLPKPCEVRSVPDRTPYYDKCDVWEFAARMAIANGLGVGGAVDALPLHLMPGDDFELWRLALEHILAELPKTPGSLIQIGRCSHWLRPHQTRWAADGGFASPTGYGSGTGGHSRRALPQFDWSVTLVWTGEKWAPAHDKSSKPVLRVAIPSRTSRHQQAAVHTIWMIEKEKEQRFYGFRQKDGAWRCTAETDWKEERPPKTRKKRR